MLNFKEEQIFYKILKPIHGFNVDYFFYFYPDDLFRSYI